MKIVLDTNVLVAVLRSRNGASFALIQQVGAHAPFQLCVSVPLVLEYESVLKRRTNLNEAEVRTVVDYFCSVADLREIHFLWRPFLRDPADEMVLEVAVEAEANAIVTHNIRDFENVETTFGIQVLKPSKFLIKLQGGDP